MKKIRCLSLEELPRRRPGETSHICRDCDKVTGTLDGIQSVVEQERSPNCSRDLGRLHGGGATSGALTKLQNSVSEDYY